MIRIAIVGNQTNMGYRTCRQMRALGHEAELYILPGELKHARSRPERIDPELADDERGYPEWIHTFEQPGKWYFLGRANPSALHIEQNYDVAALIGDKGLLAGNLLRRIPIVILSQGSEVIDLPHAWCRLKLSLRRRVASLVARRVISRAMLIGESFNPGLKSIVRLRRVHQLRLWNFPEDIEDVAQRVDHVLLEELTARYAQYRRVLVWLSRTDFDRQSCGYKGTEVFLEAYRRLVERHGECVFALIGNHGPDIDRLRRLATQYGLDPYIEWVNEMPLNRLATYLSLPNAIICDAIRPGMILAGLTREAIAVGAAVVRSYDEEITDICFGPDCPVVNVHDGDSCFEALTELVESSDGDLESLRRAHRQWGLKYLDYRIQIPRLMRAIEERVWVWRLNQGIQP